MCFSDLSQMNKQMTVYDIALHVISRWHLLPATRHLLLLSEEIQSRNAGLFRRMFEVPHLPHRATNLQLPDV